jgi:general secretion pathway protein K
MLLAEYGAAGLDYGPPHAPLERLDELGRVLGMTPAVLAAMKPHLTLFGPPDPSAATIDPVVAAALAEAVQGAPAPSPAQPPQMC